MKANDLLNSATRAFGQFGLKCKKHAPEALIVAGTVSFVATVVTACKATTKASEVTAKLQNDMETIRAAAELNEETVVYTEEDMKKDTLIAYTQAGVGYLKLYGPSIALGVASLACIIGSHTILNKRNLALAAAYTAVDQGFKDYRGRLIDRFGEALDRELRYNIKAEEVEETVVDDEGNETVVKKTVEVVDPDAALRSPYTKCFDEFCPGWTRDAELNLLFLRQQQNNANDMLRAKGYLFLNEVYEMLGIPRTREGQVIGWVYDKDVVGKVDFGLYNIKNEGSRDFVNGRERSVWLDFNVDGNIMAMI